MAQIIMFFYALIIFLSPFLVDRRSFPSSFVSPKPYTSTSFFKQFSNFLIYLIHNVLLPFSNITFFYIFDKQVNFVAMLTVIAHMSYTMKQSVLITYVHIGEYIN